MRPEHIYKVYGFYDPKWCISVEGNYRSVRCIHPEPTTFNPIESLDNSNEYGTSYSESIVTLHAMSENGARIGLIGRCDVCGKVYHV